MKKEGKKEGKGKKKERKEEGRQGNKKKMSVSTARNAQSTFQVPPK